MNVDPMTDEDMRQAFILFKDMITEAEKALQVDPPPRRRVMLWTAGMVFSSLISLTKMDWDTAVFVAKEFYDNYEDRIRQHHATH